MADTDRQPGGDWRTLAEAAAALGKSTRTVRRYVASGKLEADKSKSPMMVNLADMADKLTDTDRQEPGDWRTDIDEWRTKAEECQTQLDTCRTRAEGLETEISRLEGEISQLGADNEGLQAQVDRLRSARDEAEAKVDRLAGANSELHTRNELLEQLLDEVREERDYLRQANAAALSKIPDRGPSIWRRLLPWIGREEEG
jgi:chromosome segregation ATPase